MVSPDKYDLVWCVPYCHLYAVLTDEQRQNASMFVDPVTKFFEVILYNNSIIMEGGINTRENF